MKSDFDLLTNKTSMVSNGEALSDDSATQVKGMQPPALQLKKNSTSIRSGHTNSSGQKRNMPAQLREKMEDSFGHKFSNVAIHENSSKATNLNAKAFTSGNEIHFAPGEYKPNERSGQELLGHELTHVVQQREGNIPATTQLKGIGINSDQKLESEADQKGRTAAKGTQVSKGSNKNTTVSNPVVQGFMMGSISKMLSSTKKWAKGGLDFVKNKGKAAIDGGKNLLNKAAGSLSIVSDITNFFKRAGNAIMTIFQDPVGFIKNLLGAVKDGFLKFFGNITQHLLSGLTQWLFKALSGAGITIPQSFSLKAILSMAYQILSKVWNLIKDKLMKLIGKKALDYGAEVGQVLRKLVQLGPQAIWAVFKAKITETYYNKR